MASESKAIGALSSEKVEHLNIIAILNCEEMASVGKFNFICGDFDLEEALELFRKNIEAQYIVSEAYYHMEARRMDS